MTRTCVALLSGLRGPRSLAPATTHRVESIRLRSTPVESEDKASPAVPVEAAASPLDLAPPRGTRDFYPEDLRVQRWLFDHWRAVAAEHGFSEYDAPVLESEALYVRKAGEEVTQQLYNFEDKGGRMVSLRPEMTPSLARMVLARRATLPMPLKWFSIPQCWRYERMTRGRRREHYQWNMDIWGIPGVAAEAELLAAVANFFSRVGLTAEDIGIKVNSRQVLAEILEQFQVPPEHFAATCILVDKLEKVPVESLESEFLELGMSKESLPRLVEVLQSKTIEDLETHLGQDSRALCDLRDLFQLAEAYGIQDWLQLDASVVRGLSYYTGVVFEAFDKEGKFRAIVGGGRYDRLLETFGGEPLEAVGFGFGDAVVMEVLKDKKLMPDLTNTGIDGVVGALDPDLVPRAIEVARELREAGLNVDLVLEAKKPKWLTKHSDRLRADFVAFIGEDEAARSTVRVKTLLDGAQADVDMARIAEWAKALRLASDGTDSDSSPPDHN